MKKKTHRDELERDEALDVEGEVDLGRGGVPEALRLDELLSEDASHAEHRPARVHALGLCEPRQRLRVGAEAEGVESVVGGEAESFLCFGFVCGGRGWFFGLRVQWEREQGSEGWLGERDGGGAGEVGKGKERGRKVEVEFFRSFFRTLFFFFLSRFSRPISSFFSRDNHAPSRPLQ